MANTNRSLEVFHNSNTPIVEIYRFDFNTKTENLLTNFGYYTQHSTLLAYSFNRNINELYGTFELQVKEDYLKSETILDIIKPLDIVKIYNSGKFSELSFMGVVNTISFGATAGAYNKAITISGKSISCLFEMFQISTDASNMAFFLKEDANKQITDALVDLCIKNEKGGKKGAPLKDSIHVVFDKFKSVLTKEENIKIAASGIFDLIDYYFGSDFVSCDSNLVFEYPIVKNLFNEDTVNIYSYFKGLLPESVYEIFETIENNKPMLKVREKPFEKEVFLNLYKNRKVINPAFVTDYTISKSNEEIYTCFLASLQGSGLSAETYKIITEISNGQDAIEYDYNKLAIYGYQPLTVNFIGYNSTKTDGDNSDLKTAFIELAGKVKRWYTNLDEFYTGNITFILLNDNEVKPILLGSVVQLCKGAFYVTSENHSWSYGNSLMVNLQIERGGDYSSGSFQPLKNISSAYAELLEKD